MKENSDIFYKNALHLFNACKKIPNIETSRSYIEDSKEYLERLKKICQECYKYDLSSQYNKSLSTIFYFELKKDCESSFKETLETIYDNSLYHLKKQKYQGVSNNCDDSDFDYMSYFYDGDYY